MLSTRRFGQPLDVHLPRTLKATPEPLPEAMFMQESRVVEFPYSGSKVKSVTPPVTVIDVLVQDEDAPVVPEPDCGVPVPVIVIPMPEGTVIPLDQVQEPEGT